MSESYYYISHPVRGDFAGFSSVQRFPPMPIFVRDGADSRKQFSELPNARGTLASMPEKTARLCSIKHHPFGKVV